MVLRQWLVSSVLAFCLTMTYVTVQYAFVSRVMTEPTQQVFFIPLEAKILVDKRKK